MINGALQNLTKAVIITTAVALVLYDITAELLGGVKSTISSVIQHAAYKFPIVAAAAGVLIGHFFWQSGTLTEV